MARTPTIDPVEWDFRNLPADEIEVAVWYEAHRSINSEWAKGYPPWLTLTEEQRAAFRSQWNVPVFAGTPAVLEVKCLEDIRKIPSDLLLRVAVMGRTRAEILAEVGTLLDRPETRRRLKAPQRGKAGVNPSPLEKLKGLAAFRLKQFGMKFADMSDFMNREKQRIGWKSGYPEQWPNYAHRNGFNDAAKRFREFVSERAGACGVKSKI